MIRAPLLLRCDVNHADGAPPAQPVPHSAGGDFQKLIGQAQAGQGKAVRATLLPGNSLRPADKSDKTDRTDPSNPTNPTDPAKPPPPTPDTTAASLVLAILSATPLPEMQKAECRMQNAESHIQCGSPDSSGPLNEGRDGTAAPGNPQSSHGSTESSAFAQGATADRRPAVQVNPQSAIPNPQSAIPVPSAPAVAPPGAEIAAAKDLASNLSPPISPDGTPVASNGLRMKSATKANEIAGSAAQKLPPSRPAAPAPAGESAAIPVAKIRVPTSFSDSKESAPQWTVLDLTGKGPAVPTLTGNVQEGSVPSSGATERVEGLISREVILLHQSGAQSLAVSLKVDSQTSLFLQLTNHHGRIEASVRCEQGDAGALNAHWGRLQESLARQNVQLRPLEDRTPSSGTPSDLPAQPRGNSQDGPSARQQPPPPPALKTDKPSDEVMNAAVGVSKSKNKSRHTHGWEKWA